MEQLPQINPGFNNTPFKFTKYSNAYMLVYIRESDKEKIMCNVDEKDIAEHLRVSSSVVPVYFPTFLCIILYFC
jgi:ubiquitin carboxyl-terminal hydrolase 7